MNPHHTKLSDRVGDIYWHDQYSLPLVLASDDNARPTGALLRVWLDAASRYVVAWQLIDTDDLDDGLESTLLKHSAAHDPVRAVVLHGPEMHSSVADALCEAFARHDVEAVSFLKEDEEGEPLRLPTDTLFDWIDQQLCRALSAYFPYHPQFDSTTQQRRIDEGRVKLLSVSDLRYLMHSTLQRYHDTPLNRVDFKTPAELWASRERHERWESLNAYHERLRTLLSEHPVSQHSLFAHTNDSHNHNLHTLGASS